MFRWKIPGKSGSRYARDRRSRGHRPRWFLGTVLGLVLLLGWLELRDARIGLEIRRSEIDAAWLVLERDLDARADLAAELGVHARTAVVGSPGKEWTLARTGLDASLRALNAAEERAAAVEANLQVDRALRRFVRSLQAAPSLRGSADLLRVQEQILAAENRLAQHRTAYNEAVQRFNTSRAIFPANVAACLYGIERDPRYLPTDLNASMTIPVREAQVGDQNRPAE
jgi:LemA protein